MVAAVRRGRSLREVARAFKVALSTVQFWVGRAGELRLDRVDWSDRPSRPHALARQTTASIQERILALRKELREQSALGEYGAAAIYRSLVEEGWDPPLPHERTIHRILERSGALDGRRRIRRKPPGLGWHLPDVAGGRAEMDEADIVEDLVIRGGQKVDVFNVISVHGALAAAFPSEPIRTALVREALLRHWSENGLPGYVQFDNDTRFLGPSNHPDVLGSVPRMCLHLNVTPVFVPPRETGFQAAIESFNGRWQDKVWDRFEHETLPGLVAISDRFIAALRARNAVRLEGAPIRAPFPDGWSSDKKLLQQRPCGRIIFIRRTDGQGRATVLGHNINVHGSWSHRLVRCEIDLDHEHMRFFALRRADPADQRLLTEIPYRLPHKVFRATDLD